MSSLSLPPRCRRALGTVAVIFCRARPESENQGTGPGSLCCCSGHSVLAASAQAETGETETEQREGAGLRGCECTIARNNIVEDGARTLSPPRPSKNSLSWLGALLPKKPAVRAVLSASQVAGETSAPPPGDEPAGDQYERCQDQAHDPLPSPMGAHGCSRRPVGYTNSRSGRRRAPSHGASGRGRETPADCGPPASLPSHRPRSQ